MKNVIVQSRYSMENAGSASVLKSEVSVSVSTSWRDYLELTKPRLSMLSLITALIGYLAAQSDHQMLSFVAFLVGTAFCAGSAGALNQWLEWEADALMVRTKSRPIPAGLMSPLCALYFGVATGLLGGVIRLLTVNTLSAVIAWATVLSYVLVYTPMKKKTHWCTEVGAIPGALPPLIGWAAAEGTITTLGWILFAFLLFWQIPHFMAIAWMHREDYARGGFSMVPSYDRSGKFTAVRSLLFTVLMILSSLAPTFLGFTSWLYGAVAMLCGAWFFVKAMQFYQVEKKEVAARKLFFASIVYLPIVLIVLLLDIWLL